MEGRPMPVARTASKSIQTTKPVETPPVNAVDVQAKPAESAAAEASRIAPMDFSALVPTKVVVPVRTSGRGIAGRKVEDLTVFKNWLTDSWDSRKDGETIGEGRGFQIPVGQVGSLTSKLNRAAAALNLGVAIAVNKPGSDVALSTQQLKALTEKTPTETVVFSFVSKTRKKNKPKPAAGTATVNADKPATEDKPANE